jgi:hypothetical protein
MSDLFSIKNEIYNCLKIKISLFNINLFPVNFCLAISTIYMKLLIYVGNKNGIIFTWVTGGGVVLLEACCRYCAECLGLGPG